MSETTTETKQISPLDNITGETEEERQQQFLLSLEDNRDDVDDLKFGKPDPDVEPEPSKKAQKAKEVVTKPVTKKEKAELRSIQREKDLLEKKLQEITSNPFDALVKQGVNVDEVIEQWLTGGKTGTKEEKADEITALKQQLEELKEQFQSSTLKEKRQDALTYIESTVDQEAYPYLHYEDNPAEVILGVLEAAAKDGEELSVEEAAAKAEAYFESVASKYLKASPRKGPSRNTKMGKGSPVKKKWSELTEEERTEELLKELKALR